MTKTNASGTTRLYLLQAVGPVHIGVGESLDDINLPTARESATGYPYIPGSSLKGVLRDLATPPEEAQPPANDKEAAERRARDRALRAAFGPPTENADDARGGLVFSDASILALPVRSLFGTFAYVTCPFALRRLHRDAKEAGVALPIGEALLKRNDTPLVSKTSALVEGGKAPGVVFLEDVELEKVAVSADLLKLAEALGAHLFPKDQPARDFLAERLLLVPDDLFAHYCRNGLEVRSRVRINHKTGTAAASGPWQEEHLPAESLLHGLVLGRATAYVDRVTAKTDGKPGAEAPERKADPVAANEAMDVLHRLLAVHALLRLGGKASVGVGRARMTVVAP